MKNPDRVRIWPPRPGTKANTAKYKRSVGALGALGAVHFSELFGSGGEIPTNSNEMIRDAKVHNSGPRWYVEFREFNDTTKKWERKRAYDRRVNREKDLAAREKLIQDQYNEIMEVYSSRLKVSRSTGGETFKKYITDYMDDKKAFLRPTSIKNMKLALKYFYIFLVQKGLKDYPLDKITKQHIHAFRIELSKFTGARSVNNHLDFIKSFFQYYIDNFEDLLHRNPCRKISKLPTTTDRHMAYPWSQVRQLHAHMREKDPQLLLYCQFIGMGFLRCEEARKLRVGDIDFENKLITLRGSDAKTRTRAVKPLMEIFHRELIKAGVHLHPASHYVFSVLGRPGVRPVYKNYFQKRFKQVKRTFRISDRYTVYGFRHTTVQRLLLKKVAWLEIMKYTGHKTMAAFWEYAKTLLDLPAEDMSQYLDENYKVELAAAI